MNVALKLMHAYRWSLSIYWVIFICMYVIIEIINNASALAGNDIDAKAIWEGASTSPRIFLLVIGIMLTPLSIAGFVANGVTRKYFIWGASGLIAVYSAISALIMTLGYPIEKWIYDRYDWVVTYKNPHLFIDASQPWWMFLEYFFNFIAYFGSGWLIGSCFYRFNWKLATVLCLFALLPVLAMEAVLSSDWVGSLLQSTFDIERASIFVVVLLALCVIALLYGAGYLMLRKVTIKRKLIS